MEIDGDERGLRLVPSSPSSDKLFTNTHTFSEMTVVPSNSPPLDLNLSISIRPVQPASNEKAKIMIRNAQVLKQQTAEQIRLAAIEKAYAERLREQTRKELDLAEREFTRARLVWEQTHDEVQKAKRMRELATTRVGATCMGITCQVCRQCFKP